MASTRLQKKASREDSPGSTLSATLAYYAGTRRLRDLPDGRQVWQAFIGNLWRTYYELPLTVTDVQRIRGRLAEARAWR
jgi:hypothetical protein